VLTPAVFTHFATKFCSVPDVAVIFHLRPVQTPTVAPAERYSVSRFTAVPGCYRLVVKHGFMDEVISPDLAALLYEQVRKFVVRQAREKYGVREKEGEGEVEAAVAESVASGGGGKQWAVVPVELRDEKVAAELAHLDRAYAAKIMYIVGKEQMRVARTRRGGARPCCWCPVDSGQYARKDWDLRLTMDCVLEVGFAKEI
jgi:KUP system potassium uptake protein